MVSKNIWMDFPLHIWQEETHKKRFSCRKGFLLGLTVSAVCWLWPDKSHLHHPVTTNNQLDTWIHGSAAFHCLLWIIKTVNHINSLPNSKVLDMIKLKAFADDKLNIATMTISLFDGEENTVGKAENAGCQHFPLFPQCFRKHSSLGSLNVGIVW